MLQLFELSKIRHVLSGRVPGVLNQEQTKHSAVIIPLITVKDELSVLFEVRSKQLNTQPGEICFPGGRIDPTDPSPEKAAIRELSEELCVGQKQIDLIAPLDYLVTPFRGIIYPFVGHLHVNSSSINANKAEVDHIFTVPLSHLYNTEPNKHSLTIRMEPDANFPLNQISNSKRYSGRVDTIPELFYYYDSYVIWGLTARILHHFIELTKPR